MTIAILGWGSLLWDKNHDFDEQHATWEFDGPLLPLEFSRISKSRGNALTLVIDELHGSECQVAYTFSKRKNIEDVIADLRCREGTIISNIGFCYNNSRGHGRSNEVLKIVREWAVRMGIDIVVWTDLISNFRNQSLANQPYTLESALSHLQSLSPEGKAKAAEYVWRSPIFIQTPLKTALESVPWFVSKAVS